MALDADRQRGDGSRGMDSSGILVSYAMRNPSPKAVWITVCKMLIEAGIQSFDFSAD